MNESVFETLYQIDVNEHTEQINGLTYLSWSWAIAEMQKRFPDMKYEVKEFDGKPYLFDEDLGYMVFTSVTVRGETKVMWLPVMDGANKAMKNKPYTYKVFKWVDGKKVWNKERGEYETVDKTVEPATMFDINTAIMRCLVKNIGMFGLGLYIYSGQNKPEDLTPKITKEQALYLIRAYKGTALKKLLDSKKLNRIEDMPKEMADELIKQIEEMIKAKGEANENAV